jgi:hypothetical protein
MRARVVASTVNFALCGPKLSPTRYVQVVEARIPSLPLPHGLDDVYHRDFMKLKHSDIEISLFYDCTIAEHFNFVDAGFHSVVPPQWYAIARSYYDNFLML